MLFYLNLPYEIFLNHVYGKDAEERVRQAILIAYFNKYPKATASRAAKDLPISRQTISKFKKDKAYFQDDGQLEFYIRNVFFDEFNEYKNEYLNYRLDLAVRALWQEIPGPAWPEYPDVDYKPISTLVEILILSYYAGWGETWSFTSPAKIGKLFCMPAKTVQNYRSNLARLGLLWSRPRTIQSGEWKAKEYRASPQVLKFIASESHRKSFPAINLSEIEDQKKYEKYRKEAIKHLQKAR